MHPLPSSCARHMREIRVCWTPDVEHDERGVFRDGGVWYVDAHEIRAGLQLIASAENRTHGTNTHWIEQRDALPDPLRAKPDFWTVDNRRRLALPGRERLNSGGRLIGVLPHEVY